MDLGDNLLRFKPNQKYLIWDTETCHLNLEWTDNVPWEWAWMICTKDEILEKHEYLVKWPKINISPEAAAMTGFYQKQPRIALYGKEPAELLDMFDKLLYDESLIPIAHNGLGFDVYMHNIHRRLCGRPTDYSYVSRFIDTNCIARAMKLNVAIPADRAEWPAFQYRLLGHRVKGVKTAIKALCPEFEIEYDITRAHEALYDCQLLYQIWQKLLYRVEI